MEEGARPDDLITLAEAAALAGVGYQTMYIVVRTGRIAAISSNDPHLRRGGGGRVTLLHRADVEAYIARRNARKARGPLTNAERQRRKYAKKKEESRSQSVDTFC